MFSYAAHFLVPLCHNIRYLGIYLFIYLRALHFKGITACQVKPHNSDPLKLKGK